MIGIKFPLDSSIDTLKGVSQLSAEFLCLLNQTHEQELLCISYLFLKVLK